MLSLSTKIKKNKDLVEAEFEDELVMMSIEKGSYLGLDSIGTRIWQLLEKPQEVVAICDQLQEEYEVEEAQCQQDVLKLLEDMAEQKVILLVD